MPEKNLKTQGILSLTSAAFLYGFFGIITRYVGFSLSFFFQMWVRALISVLILLIIVYLTKQWKRVERKDMKWIVLRALAGIVGFSGSFVSFYYLPIGTALFIFYGGTTVGGYILGKIFFQENMTKAKAASLFLAIIGLSFIYSLSIRPQDTIYVVMALVAGLGTAVWNIFSKKISSKYAATQLNLLDYMILFCTVFFLSIVLKETWVMPTFSTVWIANIVLVAMFLLTGQLIIYGFNRLDAQVGSLIMLSEILFGIILSYLFFGEVISVLGFIGGGLVVAAIILPELRIKKLNQPI